METTQDAGGRNENKLWIESSLKRSSVFGHILTMAADPLNRKVIDLALADATDVYDRTGDLDRVTLLRLSELFGANLLQSAFETVASGAVKRLVAANSKRTVVQARDFHLQPNCPSNFYHSCLPFLFHSIYS